MAAISSTLGRRPEKRDADRWAKLLFILPAVVYLLLLSVFPFLYSVYLSLFDAKLTRLHRKFYIGLENYETLLSDPVFLKSIQNTAVLTVSSIALEIVLGFACA